MLIDDFQRSDFVSALGTPWRAVSDRVMGGVSEVALDYRVVDERRGLGLSGTVRRDNNGGFVQMALDLSASGGSRAALDASAFRCVELLVHGNGEQYSLHLRTEDVTRPWQSYRSHFVAAPEWRTVRLAFDGFRPHRLAAPFDARRLRRLGVVAIGRAFEAEFTVAELRFC